MTDPRPDRRRQPVRGCPRSSSGSDTRPGIGRPALGGLRGRVRPGALVALPAAVALTLAGCGPSPVDMVEHPVTTTPSRMAGEELQRSAEPEESCAPAPVPAESPGAGERRVGSDGPGPEQVSVPREPTRILALGAGAVDVACALGLQDLVVGTSGLPADADVYLPRPLVDLPVVDLTADGGVDAARDLRPDLVVLGRGAHVDDATAERLVDELSDLAPTVVYDADVLHWTDATEAVADAYGRPRAGGDLLLDVIARAEATAAKTTPSDTRVSLLRVRGDSGPDVHVEDPGTLGSLMLEAVGAGRPPAQRTRDGERIPPLPHEPQVGDELDGDVIFAVVGGGPDAEEDARAVFGTDEWQDLDAVGARRMFVVDAAVWEGAGPVAARAVLGDIENSINGIAPDG